MTKEENLTKRLRRLGTWLETAWYVGDHATPRARAVELAQYRLWMQLKVIEHERWQAERDLVWPNGLPAHP